MKNLMPEKPEMETHRCHVPNCPMLIPPRMLMCKGHWVSVPTKLKKQIYKTYRAGQEIDKQPSVEYLQAAREAIKAVQIKSKQLEFRDPELFRREFLNIPRCDTTSTERFENPDCKCPTYPENLGPCKTFELGGNRRCAYCDHEKECHERRNK